MASVQNSFDLLEAAGSTKAGQSQQAGGKKKNKNKTAAPTSGQQPKKTGQGRENGFHPAQGNGGPGTQAPGASIALDTPAIAPLEAWERAARERRSAESRSALWKEWISNVRASIGWVGPRASTAARAKARQTLTSWVHTFSHAHPPASTL